MKRALVLLLITSMLSTGTVYAAAEPDVCADVPVYSEESSQSESGDYSDYGESEDYSSQEEYSDYDSGDTGMSGESDGEASSADENDVYSDSDSAGYSESTADSGDSADVSSSADAVSGEEKAGAADSAAPASVSDGSEVDAVSESKEVKAEEANPSEEGKTEGRSEEKDTESEEIPESSDSARGGMSDSKDLKGDAGYDSDDSYISSGNEPEEIIGDVNGSADAQSRSDADSAAAAPLLKQSGNTDENSKRTRIAIMSDIHYVTDRLISELGRDDLKNAALTETRLMEEIDAILTAALKGASKAEPDALLICGDLVSNGELLGAKALAAKLKAAKEKDGFENTGFYVVNGNHDINNSYAADFTGEKATGADRVQPSDFKEIFSGLGYGDDDHWAGGSHSIYVPTSDDPSDTKNHGGLSYAADIADGITLIVLDTGIYRTDESGQSMYNDAQKTAGYVSDDLLAWAAAQAKEAKAKGNLVLAMSHHGLLPHYDVDLEDKGAWYMNSFRVPNWENVAETLADAGVTAVLTGHTHANDIASYVSKNNNVLYDVETAALCAYPCIWRAFDIVTSGEGEEKTYTISIDTTYINEDLEADTSSWSFTIGDKTKTFDGDYNSNLQEYSYEKTGIHEGMLDSTAMYMVKNTLSDILNHEGGLAGYIKEQLNVPESMSLGDYAAGALRKMISDFPGFTKELSTALFKGSVGIENATQEGDENPTLNITAELNGVTEHGKAILDMSYIPTAVDEMTAKAEQKLLEGEWLKNPYASNPLLDDIRNLIKNGVIPALSQPLEEDDPESSAVKMVNDAWQTFSLGDEGLADDAQKAKWEHERELLGGEVLAGKLTEGLWKEVLKLNTSAYPILNELLTQRIVGEEKTGILSVATENPTDYLLPAITNLLGINKLDTFSSIIRTASSLDMLGMGNLIPASAVKPLTDKVVGLHEVMTTDNNIKHDNTWEFRMVRFDANGGSVGRTHALTVEDHKLVSLPTPDEREDYTFDGWFTSETGGRQVTADDDMTGISTLYAHWTYTGEEREDPKPADDDDEKPKPDDEKPKPDDRKEDDGSRETPEERKDENIVPVKPSENEKTAAPSDKSDNRNTAGENRSARDLHSYFVSRKALHDKILKVEYIDVEHEKFCAAIVSALKNGETVFNMGKWLSLNAEAVAAIEDSKTDVTLEYVGQGIGFRVVIPAGSKISRFADEQGSVCVVCLAESYGYETIGEEDILRRPLG